MTIPILNVSYLLDGVAYFRPYIRAFIVFLLVLFNVRMFLSLINQDAGFVAGKVAESGYERPVVGFNLKNDNRRR